MWTTNEEYAVGCLRIPWVKPFSNFPKWLLQIHRSFMTEPFPPIFASWPPSYDNWLLEWHWNFLIPKFDPRIGGFFLFHAANKKDPSQPPFSEAHSKKDISPWQLITLTIYYPCPEIRQGRLEAFYESIDIGNLGFHIYIVLLGGALIL